MEVVELLLAAGYFRARIKGLTPFDKVSLVYCLLEIKNQLSVTSLFYLSVNKKIQIITTINFFL